MTWNRRVRGGAPQLVLVDKDRLPCLPFSRIRPISRLDNNRLVQFVRSVALSCFLFTTCVVPSLASAADPSLVHPGTSRVDGQVFLSGRSGARLRPRINSRRARPHSRPCVHRVSGSGCRMLADAAATTSSAEDRGMSLERELETYLRNRPGWVAAGLVLPGYERAAALGSYRNDLSASSLVDAAHPEILLQHHMRYVPPDGRPIDGQAAFVGREGEEAEPQASSSVSSRKIACIQAGASLRSFTSSRRLSAGSVRFRCSRRAGVTCCSPSSRSACISRPLSRPAASMFRGPCRSRIIVGPIVTVRLGPSVRKTAFAGTCSDRPRRFAAQAPAGWSRVRSRPASAGPRPRRHVLPGALYARAENRAGQGTSCRRVRHSPLPILPDAFPAGCTERRGTTRECLPTSGAIHLATCALMSPRLSARRGMFSDAPGSPGVALI